MWLAVVHFLRYCIPVSVYGCDNNIVGVLYDSQTNAVNRYKRAPGIYFNSIPAWLAEKKLYYFHERTNGKNILCPKRTRIHNILYW